MQVLLLLAIALLPQEAPSYVLTAVLTAAVLTLGAIDFRTMRVPNVIVYPTTVFVLIATAIIDVHLLDDALLGLGIAGVSMFFLALLGRGALGMGDVKFGALVGAGLGWRLGLGALALGFCLGGITSALLLISRRKSRKDFLPLVPFLSAGTFVVILLWGTLVL
ncbi:MAG TPA: A24 family peptidase [Dehalococcoidia bacterium]|nr:A24 family peptidase [Dehalococcoidia bacterium]